MWKYIVKLVIIIAYKRTHKDVTWPHHKQWRRNYMSFWEHLLCIVDSFTSTDYIQKVGEVKTGTGLSMYANPYSHKRIRRNFALNFFLHIYKITWQAHPYLSVVYKFIVGTIQCRHTHQFEQ